MIIETKNISKHYSKEIVLNDLNLKIDQGEILCLLGKNGAGKTTFINILIDLIKQDKGKILFNNRSYKNLPFNIKKNIGVLSEKNPLIEELTVNQFLTLMCKLYKIRFEDFENRKNDLMSYFFDNPKEIGKKRLANFSTGMKKKIGIIAASLHKPELLILDEPFSGLDPIAANKALEFIKFYRNENRTVLLSSHDLGYVEKIATRIVVLDENRFIFNGTIAQFTQDGHAEISASLLKLLQSDDKKYSKPEWL